MAEARRAVEPIPSLKLHEGIDPEQPRFQTHASHHGVSFFIPAPRFIIRGIYRFLRQSTKKVQQAFMPLPASAAFVIIFGALGWVLNSKSTSFIRNSKLSNLLWDLDSKMPYAKHFTVQQRVAYLTFNTTVAIIGSFTAFHRLLLRSLLSYTRWMDEGRGTKSLKTTIWGLLLKYIYIRGAKPSTYAYQSSLPHFPLPGLADTCKRYLASMEPILDPEEYKTLCKEAEEFQQKEGKKLQGYLKWKYWFSKNYVADWWLDVVYLRGRESLMINSNYYGLGMPTVKLAPKYKQVPRAAKAINNLVRAKLELEREQLPPTLINGIVPMCMNQYHNVFSLTRVPGLEIDRLVKYSPLESRHIVVYHKGRFYKVHVFSHHTGRMLTPQELAVTLEGIVNSPENADPTEECIPALTAWNRTKWAEVRRDLLLRNKINRSTLDIIESAMFFVVLDHEAHSDYTSKGRSLLHNNGCKIWFDKSFTVIIDSEGDYGMNGEHSWGDAPALGHIWEYNLAYDAHDLAYDEEGNLKPGPETQKQYFYHAERLPWSITPELRDAVLEAKRSAQQQIEEFSLHSDRFEPFGKNRVTKVLKCSPDAFVQMALQLAFWRDQGKFVQTYESAMARLYVDGRTETIRSQSAESVAFVKAMENPKATKEERLTALRKACEKHVVTTTLAMTGRGVDRHLFALYVVAVGTNTESPFLLKVLKRGWKLSTSQVPATQAPHLWKVPHHQDSCDVYPRPSGGFGPVADDGYGVSYLIAGTKAFHFHVSAKKTCSTTDAKRMYENIYRALCDMSALSEEQEPEHKSKKH